MNKSLQVHNPLQMLVLQRIKYQLGYPESAKDVVKPKSLFTGKLSRVMLLVDQV